MKIPACFILFICCYFQLNAQARLAVKGGFNYSGARVYDSSLKKSTGFVPGGNLALQLKVDFDGILHFSPYLGYSSRGFIIKEGNGNPDKLQTLIHYIDLGAVLSADLPTGKGNSFVISAGPTGGFAIGGKVKTTVNGVTSSANMNFSTEKDYGYIDLGLHTALGYHFNKFFIEAAWQYSFTNINNNEESDKRNIRNRTFSLNVGYFFKNFK